MTAVIEFEEGKRYFLVIEERSPSHPTRKELVLTKGDVISVPTGVLPVLFDGQEYFFGEATKDGTKGYFPRNSTIEMVQKNKDNLSSTKRRSMFLSKKEPDVSQPTVVKHEAHVGVNEKGQLQIYGDKVERNTEGINTF